LILLSDANILIDFALVNGLEHLVRLGPIEVLDVVFEEADEPAITNPDQLGLVIVKVQTDWVTIARGERQGKLSLPDALCLYYARTQGRVLLTTDAPLRKYATAAKVEVHGSLWVVKELFERDLCDAKTLCAWLENWPKLNARLPVVEVGKLKMLLKCGQ
jgi:predicted nucleic acid-binding protein